MHLKADTGPVGRPGLLIASPSLMALQREECFLFCLEHHQLWLAISENPITNKYAT